MAKFVVEHLEDLRKSGLSDKTIINSGIRSIPVSELNQKLGFKTYHVKSAYEIPYDDDFSRFRIFYKENNSDRPEFLQKKGSKNRLYIPKSIKNKLNDNKIPLYITIGEKRALKACQEGLCCVGIGGPCNWSDGTKHLIPDFYKINFNNRKVYIVIDNHYFKHDPSNSPKYYHFATIYLARNIMGMVDSPDIEPCIYEHYIPPDYRQYFDEYLVHHSVDEFLALPRFDVEF